MLITKFNYEVYVLDFLEGHLSEDLREEMLRFLKAHPEIEQEVRDMKDMVYLQPDEQIIFLNKKALLKESESKLFKQNNYWLFGVAASVALIIIAFLMGYESGKLESKEVALEQQIEQPAKSVRDRTILSSSTDISSSKKTEEGRAASSFSKQSIVAQPNTKVASKAPIANQVVSNTTSPIRLSEEHIFTKKRLISSVSDEQANIKVSKPFILIQPLPQKKYVLEKEDYLNRAINTKALFAAVKIIQPNKHKYQLKNLLTNFSTKGIAKESFIPSFFTEEVPSGQ